MKSKTNEKSAKAGALVNSKSQTLILVVDDDESLREAIVYDFSKRGYLVLSAENGTLAFELVLKNEVDVILTDVRMPNGSGIELLDRVKARNAILPAVILVTGYSDISIDEAYAKGAEAVFFKPFDRKSLFDSVDRIVKSLRVENNPRVDERFNTNFNILLEFDNLKIDAVVRNIGRGGMFVDLKHSLPAVDTRIKFYLRYGAKDTLEGGGIVRWTREVSAKGRPIGLGIEFEALKANENSQILMLINKLKTIAFIPNE